MSRSPLDPDLLTTPSAVAFLAWYRRQVPERPAELVGDLRAFHVCGGRDRRFGLRNQRLLWPNEPCPDCQWSASFPIPAIDGCARRLVALLGADAERWTRVLLCRVLVLVGDLP